MKYQQKRFENLKEDIYNIMKEGELKTIHSLLQDIRKIEKYQYVAFETIKRYLNKLKAEGRVKNLLVNKKLSVWQKV